jgi:c-di-GMP-binding flagellar brake protein YcgR
MPEPVSSKQQPQAGQTGTTQSKPSPVEAGNYAQYLLRAKSEIQFILHGLLEAVSQMTVFFNEGKDMLLTTLVDLDDEYIYLDFGASMEVNRKALTVDRLFCVTQQDKVRIQFILRGLEQVEFAGRPAFRALLPDEVLRLQRREFFRLTTPVMKPLKCVIPVPDTSGNMNALEVSVVDVSGGGIAIALPEGVDLNPDIEFRGCRMELPEIGVITTNLRIRNQFEITLKSGGRVRRAGCEFMNLAGPMLTLLQRYIIKVERERKARESGLL